MSEWTPFGGTWSDFQRGGLSHAGCEIETGGEYVRRLLIGDINEVGGDCDDCMGIRRHEVVARYRRVYEAASQDDDDHVLGPVCLNHEGYSGPSAACPACQKLAASGAPLIPGGSNARQT